MQEQNSAKTLFFTHLYTIGENNIESENPPEKICGAKMAPQVDYLLKEDIIQPVPYSLIVFQPTLTPF